MNENSIITVITINYNDAQGLKKTMDSVLQQSCNDFEYIVIDGNSTDGSKEVLNSFSNEKLIWVSESDTGIYNAMNKGIKLAKGKYLLFLNSGDILVSNEVLERSIPKINSEASFIGFNLLLETKKGRKLREHPEKISFSYLVSNTLSHPATLIKREMFDIYGYYNEENKIISDWEFFFKAIGLHGESFQMITEVLTVFDMHGISSKKENLDLVRKEREQVIKKYLATVYNSDLDTFIFDQFKEPTKRIKYLMRIERSPYLRKLTTFTLSMISFFVKKQ
jgi:glycosyltransferase involved in cell wall biosynthesis